MERLIGIFKAVSDPNRLRTLLALRSSGELCVCDIAEMLGLAMGTVSRHMDVLKKAHLVKARKEGRWVYYRLSEEFPPKLLNWITEEVAEDPQMRRDAAQLTTMRVDGKRSQATEPIGKESP